MLALTDKGIEILKTLHYNDNTKEFYTDNSSVADQSDIDMVIDYMLENFGKNMSTKRVEYIKESILQLDKYIINKEDLI